MAALTSSPILENDFSSFDVDKLSSEIFSILENKFLFGYDDCDTKTKNSGKNNSQIPIQEMKSGKHVTGKVRILSIDGGGSTDGVLAARSLSHLEDFLRRKSGKPDARVADYFDVVAGSGVGGLLAALLFTRGKDKDRESSTKPMFTAEEALSFVLKNRLNPSREGIFRRFFRSGKMEKVLKKTFGDFTLKDTLKSVLIPCYDLSTRGPFVFSRADGLEMDGYDFKMKDVCLATTATEVVEMKSVDRKTKIAAVDGGVAMNNPTAAAITHVLNNKQEFPFCNGVEDLLVVSLGNGQFDMGFENLDSTPSRLLKIAGDGDSDMVDQAVSMAFGNCRTSNYVRIQGNGSLLADKNQATKCINKNNKLIDIAEEFLAQKSVESVLFEGKKMGKKTNLNKLEEIGVELLNEGVRRKTSILPTVILKHASSSPRTSSATTLSSLSSCN